ncbi:MAG: hypothetical protein MAG794_00784 [Gammaproteobacteria bacterium]|nr:hypothetical protein [Gammaproteobacteria bacterium]
MVRALPGRKPNALAFAPRVVVRVGDLHRRIHRFRAGVDEEDVIQIRRRELGHPPGELESPGLGDLEGRGVVELPQLLVDGIGDLPPAMPGGAAEQPGGPVQYPAAVLVPDVDAFSPDHDPGVRLEIAVAGERHPVVVHAVLVEFHS